MRAARAIPAPAWAARCTRIIYALDVAGACAALTARACAASSLRHMRYSCKPFAHLHGEAVGAAAELCRALGAHAPITTLVHALMDAAALGAAPSAGGGGAAARTYVYVARAQGNPSTR